MGRNGNKRGLNVSNGEIHEVQRKKRELDRKSIRKLLKIHAVNLNRLAAQTDQRGSRWPFVFSGFQKIYDQTRELGRKPVWAQAEKCIGKCFVLYDL